MDIDKYLSELSHDLRNQIVVIREGMSQVSEGLGNKDCHKCFNILKPALECTDKLNKLIEKLSPSMFKSVSERQDKCPERDELETSKKKIVGVISHEVRTPMTVVKEGLSLLLDEIPGELNPEQKKCLSAVKNNVDRLTESLEKMLHASWDELIKKYR